MITFFTIPKPFAGHIGIIQRNAIGSWTRVDPAAQVLVFGDEEGSAEAAADLGAEHVAGVARNEHGTPLLSDAFARAERLARNRTLCFANTDLILFRDLAEATARIDGAAERYLLIGECWNAAVAEPIDWSAHWESGVRALPARKRGADALDYFVFTPGLFAGMPEFAIGRTAFDNWLVWRARHDGALVVDLSPAVRPVHQDHDYAHGGSLAAIRVSPEAERNRQLAGGKGRLYSRFDATHRLSAGRLRRNPLATGRVGERSRRAVTKLRYKVLGVPPP